MNLLALVLAGHLVGDWIVQTDWQAANKVRPEFGRGIHKTRSGLRFPKLFPLGGYWLSWRANQQHMLGYHVTLGFALIAGGMDDWSGLLILAVSWVSHSFIDRRWPVRWLMAHTGSQPFSQTTFGVIAVDQALHLSILCLLVAGLS